MAFASSFMLPAVLDLFKSLQQSYTCAGIAILICLVIYVTTRSQSQIDAIPAIGNTGFLPSYVSSLRFLQHAEAMLQEGYVKYQSKIFRIPELSRWRIIVSDEKHIEELGRASDDTLSIVQGVRDLLASDTIFGPNLANNPYHVDVIRTQLTRNLGNLFADVRDEVIKAFNDNVPATSGPLKMYYPVDWIKIKVHDTVMKIVSCTTNRTFVGVPTCRNPEYAALNIQFSIDVAIGSNIITLFPEFLRQLACRLFTSLPKAIETGLKHLRPIIEERQRMIDDFGFDYPDKPNDMLSWLMDEAKGEERSIENLTRRILTVNFAAIHTTSMSFTHALYDLAMYPQYIEPIRAEIEAVIAEEGWGRTSLTQMRKLDSFLRESQRATGFSELLITRKVMKPYAFSDGTTLPKGAFVSVMSARHKDEKVYHRAHEFDGFRFSRTYEKGDKGNNSQYVTTSPDYLTFGQGRHACPGRFFAANELKLMMAHVLMTYDFKLETEGVRPPDSWIGAVRRPNGRAEMLFRKRRN